MKRDDLWLPLRFGDSIFDCNPIIVDTGLIPFQFRTKNSSTGTVAVYLVDSEISLDIKIFQIGDYTYYIFDGTISLPLGTYYLKIVDGGFTYYSVPFSVCDLEPLGNGLSRRDDIHLPLRFREGVWNTKPIIADNNHLLPFQFRTLNSSTGTVTSFLVNRNGHETVISLNITILQIGKWTYYLWSGTVDEVDAGVYYLKLIDGVYEYYSVPFEVCDIESDVEEGAYGYLYKFLSGGGDPYGALYNWYAVNDARGFAPDGWHVPTRDEILTLITELGGDSVSGGKLKDTGDTYWGDGNIDATNESGFTGRGSGDRTPVGSFENLQSGLIIWTSEEYSSSYAYSWILAFSFDGTSDASGSSNFKNYGLAVRLIKDDSNDEGLMTGNDGRQYKTVLIGSQVWMAENLAETRYRNGDDIPIVTGNSEWAALTTGAMCYNGNETRKEIAPIGWHVPTVQDTIDLAEAIDTAYTYTSGHGGDNVAGKEMKETGTDYWLTDAGTNSSGFNGRGAGWREPDGTFDELKSSLNIWTDKSDLTGNAYFAGLYHNEDWFNVGDYYKSVLYGLSVRLVKDFTDKAEGEEGTMTGNDGKIYTTKVIGGKEWMTQNLAETKYRDGTLIPKITDAGEWAAATEGYCAYNNDENNV